MIGAIIAIVLAIVGSEHKSHAATFSLSGTVEPIRELTILPDGVHVHIKCNTGEKLETAFEWNGVNYQLTGCVLPEHKYIDTICTLTKVGTPFVLTPIPWALIKEYVK